MTLATGKGGRYRYYKCNTRLSRGNKDCSSDSLPMEKLDKLVLQALADKVFSPSRVKTMLKEMQQRLKRSHTCQGDRLRPLNKELNSLQIASDRLYEAVEKGLLPMDSTLQDRAHKIQVRRQALLVEIAQLKHQGTMPLSTLRPNQIILFSNALKDRLLNNKAGFAKDYLKLLVEEIRAEGKEVRMRGSFAALAQAVTQTNKGIHGRVPSFVPKWLPGTDSNRRPSD